MSNADLEPEAEHIAATAGDPFVIVPEPRIPRTSEGTMSEDSAAAYISWLAQANISPRTLLDWRSKRIGPDFFQPEGTRIVTYERRLIDLWFWSSKKVDRAA